MSTITVNGKRYNLLWSKMAKDDGRCAHPEAVAKYIRLDTRLCKDSRKLMRVAIHEICHAEFWCLDEDAVEQFAVDVERLLYRLGYRRIPEEDRLTNHKTS